MADSRVNDNNTCVVCFKNVLYYSIGECDHPVCYECSTRMRVLCLQNECPICRKDLSRVSCNLGSNYILHSSCRLSMNIINTCSLRHSFQYEIILYRLCSLIPFNHIRSYVIKYLLTNFLRDNLRLDFVVKKLKMPMRSCWRTVASFVINCHHSGALVHLVII